jgi:hypothetical protein
MKLKISLVILVIGYALDFIGAWMKITHQAPADFVLTAAMFLKLIGLLVFVFLLLSHPKVKEFLNYDQYKDSFK